MASDAFWSERSPASFQRDINNILRQYLDDFCSSYVGDVLIFTDGNLSEHENEVFLIPEKLKKAGLGLDIEKCEFGVKTTKYLGFIISFIGRTYPLYKNGPKK